jgi:hypothetical protein
MEEKIKVEPLSAEEKHKMAANSLEKHQWFLMSGLIKEGLDPRIFIKVNTEVHKNGGTIMGKSFKERLRLGDDAEAVIKGSSANLDVAGFKYEIISSTKQQARLRITKCTNWETIKELQLEKVVSGEELCASCRAVTEAFGKAICSHITLSWPRCRSRGDSTCEVEYRIGVELR